MLVLIFTKNFSSLEIIINLTQNIKWYNFAYQFFKVLLIYYNAYIYVIKYFHYSTDIYFIINLYFLAKPILLL